ncbi:MAG: acetolactate synthase [Rhodococcus sp. (in: high G+C Gram-positive bacteria)]|uniref:acetolactate synthase n=1 Tax=Rhodococcus sp. TaxID=1831 RepID=UPI003BB55182
MASDIEGHGGDLAAAIAHAHGARTMFTLSGAHVFPLYDAVVKGESRMRLVDVRHEQTAVFAAEATGKLERRPGLAVLTAGPGVTNGVSAVTQAHFSGSPLVVLGGRAPNARWGTGSLQELDQPPLLSTVTKLSETARTVDRIAPVVDAAFRAAGSSHRGPTFVDIPMDELFSRTTIPNPIPAQHVRIEPDRTALTEIAGLLARASRPIVVFGTDVWSDGAEAAALRFVEELRVPAITNGMGRGIVPGGHPLLATKARGTAVGTCDLAIVVGTPLDFRLGYGRFGGRDGSPAAQVVHIADSPGQVSAHAALTGSVSGDLTACLDGIVTALPVRPDTGDWVRRLRDEVVAVTARERELLGADSDPIHPARIYGELLPRLADDAVVIGDGGDFVSFAGKFVEPSRPGRWLDPGPYGCLGAGLGAAIAARVAHPSSQVVLLLGDGAAGMSLMDIDTLVRHRLPVVIVVGNNSAWGLEKGPMQLLYGYDVAADLAPGTRYDEVATALGAGGEVVRNPRQIGAALDRAFAANGPYLVNILTDVDAVYPRSTTGI